VKRYSSGMYVRLGFSIAAHLDSDILLLDEVLAVGDAKFQEKCRGRILELKRAGKTIVFISHDLAAVRELCDRALLLNHGRLVTEGCTSDVIAHYATLGSERPKEQTEAATGIKDAQVTSLLFFDEAGLPTTELRTGGPVRALLEYEAACTLERITIRLLFYSSGDWTVASEFTARDIRLAKGPGAIEFFADEFALGPGAYAASCTIEDPDREIDFVSKTYFSVRPGVPIRGRFHAPHRWRHLTEAAEFARSASHSVRGRDKE
jgi:hypothetical protein